MMFRHSRTLTVMVLLAVPVACVTPSYGDDATAGVVRISDRPTPSVSPYAPVFREQSPEAVLNAAGPSETTQVLPAAWTYENAGEEYEKPSLWRRMSRRDRGDCRVIKPRKQRMQGFGFGAYDITYAVDPYYQDPRDSRVYSAQGWGVPMGVPLAPTVSHSYNYGWGIPSSRMTPVSRPVGYGW